MLAATSQALAKSAQPTHPSRRTPGNPPVRLGVGVVPFIARGTLLTVPMAMGGDADTPRPPELPETAVSGPVNTLAENTPDNCSNNALDGAQSALTVLAPPGQLAHERTERFAVTLLRSMQKFKLCIFYFTGKSAVKQFAEGCAGGSGYAKNRNQDLLSPSLFLDSLSQVSLCPSFAFCNTLFDLPLTY